MRMNITLLILPTTLKHSYSRAMTELQKILLSPGCSKSAKKALAEADVCQAKSKLEWTALLSKYGPSTAIVSEANHKIACEYGLLAEIARANLELKVQIILHKQVEGALPEMFDKWVSEIKIEHC